MPAGLVFALAAATSWSHARVHTGLVAPIRASHAPFMLAEPKQSTPQGFLQDASKRIACASCASAATWGLIAKCNVNSVAASSAIGLAAGASLPAPLATAAFCGTFAGMGSLLVVPGIANAAGLGAAAAALLATLDATNTRVLKGYGGRLGAVAALASFASIAATPSLVQSGYLFQPSLAKAAAAPKAFAVTIGGTIVGSTAMRLWAKKLAMLLLVGGTTSPLLSTPSKRAALARRLSNPVASASVVGLTASLVIGPSDAALAASAFTGAFVSMSSPQKVGSVRSLIGAAALAGLAQVGLAAVGVGAGGKLGAAAAIGVLLMRSLRAAAAVVLLWNARAEAPQGPVYDYHPARRLF